VIRKNLAYVLAQSASLGGSALLAFGSTLIFAPEDRSRLGVFLVVSAIIGNASCLGVNFEIFRMSALGNFRGAMQACIRFIPKQVVVGVALCVAFDSYLFLNNRLEIIEAIILLLVSITIGISIQFSYFILGSGKFVGVTVLKGFAPASSILVVTVTYLLVGNNDLVIPAMVVYFLACVAVAIVLWLYCKPFLHSQDIELEPKLLIGNHLWVYLSQTLLQVYGKLIILVGAALADPKWLGVVSVALAIAEISLNFIQISGAQSLRAFSKNLTKVVYVSSLIRSAQATAIGLVLVVLATLLAKMVVGAEYTDIPMLVFGLSIGVTANALIVNSFNAAVASKDLIFTALVLSFMILLNSISLSLAFIYQCYDLGILIWAACQWAIGFSLHFRVLRRQSKKWIS
jgi:hypothetical protein